MNKYAVIVGGQVVNVAVADDPAFASKQAGWVDLTAAKTAAWIGWTYDGKTWTAPKPDPAANTPPGPVK